MSGCGRIRMGGCGLRQHVDQDQIMELLYSTYIPIIKSK